MATDPHAMSHLMNENRTFPPKEDFQKQAHVHSIAQFQKDYAASLDDPEAFWLKQAETLSWFQKPTKALSYKWDPDHGEVWHRFFEDGTINVSYNCLDRHMGT